MSKAKPTHVNVYFRTNDGAVHIAKLSMLQHRKFKKLPENDWAKRLGFLLLHVYESRCANRVVAIEGGQW